jgi:acetyl-CoA acyltransferase
MGEAVIVGGVRTPFVKAGDLLMDTAAPELGRLVVQELLYRTNVRPDAVDELICGNVASPIDAANVARVISLRAGIPQDKIAHTVNRNCASGLESITQAATRINAGLAKTVVAVGVDSMSNIPLFFRKKYGLKLMALAKAKSAWQRLRAIGKFRPSDFAPLIGIKLGLTDPVTGMMMGDTAEKLAREYHITRDDQDQFALNSHLKAAQAWESKRLANEVMTLYPERKSKVLDADIGPRASQSMQSLLKLKPYFDRKWGTVTVGNSCQVTDGAVGLMLMDSDYADSLGITPIGKIKAMEYAGCDPERMGLGPVYSTAKALQSSGMTMDDIDLVELNEAFAAQVIACQRGFEKAPHDCGFDASTRLKRINEDVLNVNGGAIALGHPVGATGTRLVLTLLHELERRDQQHGLATLCIGGGQGGALIVERLAA